MNKGDIVLVRSNEDEPLRIGVYLGRLYDVADYRCAKHEDDLPVVRLDGMDMIVMGKCIPYNGNLVEELAKISPKEQWKLLCDLDR